MDSRVVVVGLQWGDEGKGKAVDLLSKKADAVVRFQGGHNAGHTLVVDNEKFILHLIPSGILHPSVQCFLGQGVVVSPEALRTEINDLQVKVGNIRERLFISYACPLILPSHVKLDLVREQYQDSSKIGTTGKGIGPAYEDKYARRGIRIGELLNWDRCRDRIRSLIEYHNFLLNSYYGVRAVNLVQIEDQLLEFREFVKPMLTDTVQVIQGLSREGKRIVLEGAQGTLLDIDLGTYPFVTSSHTTAASAAVGSGLSHQDIDQVLGIVKAYTTRVGNGPFPTEQQNSIGQKMREKGAEKGATTGRDRRCGWLDLVAVKNAVRVNGVTQICLTKLDVLDGFKEILVCTDYESANGCGFSGDWSAENYKHTRPIYTEMKGWDRPTANLQSFEELPQNTLAYLDFIERYLEVPIELISTGPNRESTILKGSFA